MSSFHFVSLLAPSVHVARLGLAHSDDVCARERTRKLSSSFLVSTHKLRSRQKCERSSSLFFSATPQVFCAASQIRSMAVVLKPAPKVEKVGLKTIAPVETPSTDTGGSGAKKRETSEEEQFAGGMFFSLCFFKRISFSTWNYAQDNGRFFYTTTKRIPWNMLFSVFAKLCPE